MTRVRSPSDPASQAPSPSPSLANEPATPSSGATPGPWSFEKDSAGMWSVVWGEAYCYNPIVASMWRNEGRFNSEANARLISATPDMKTALEAIIALADEDYRHAIGTQGGLDGWNEAEARGSERCAAIAREALAKATTDGSQSPVTSDGEGRRTPSDVEAEQPEGVRPNQDGAPQ